MYVSPSKLTKKSSINLGVQDAQGWSTIHHVVAPLEYGSYDNVEMLDILVNAGAPLQQRDNAGLMALDYALIRGTTKLAKELQELSEQNQNQWVSRISCRFYCQIISKRLAAIFCALPDNFGINIIQNLIII